MLPLAVTLYFAAGAAQAASCPAGTYSGNGSDRPAACQPARPGYFVSGTGATAPRACSPGRFQPASAQTSCLPARAGSFVAVAAASATAPAPRPHAP